MKETEKITVSKAMKWIDDNPAPTAYMFELAAQKASEGRHFSFRLIAEQARAKNFGEVKSAGFKLPNEFVPIFTRVFLKEHPEARPYVSLRKSRFDAELQKRGI